MGDQRDIDGSRSVQLSEFAAALQELRKQAGNPSFRKMAQLSGCVSHTTLHEAATGARFPSWETTREFVKACGADPVAWQANWKRARGEPSDQARDIPASSPPQRRQIRHRGWRVLAVCAGIAILLLAVATGVIAAVNRSSRNPTAMVTESSDASRFIADVTIPDNTVVTVNQHFQKVWQIQNIGSVPWHGRYLQRMDLPPGPGTCRTPARVPIGDTYPGQMAMISVNVVAPRTPGICWVGWKMVDSTGHYLMPHYRPVYFLVRVVANPPSP